MKKDVNDFAAKRCVACEGGIAPLSESEVNNFLGQLPNWSLKEGHLFREYIFKNHYQATAFVNAVVFVSHQENHHPYIRFGFKDVQVEYWTHAVDGITENDFICAVKVEALLGD